MLVDLHLAEQIHAMASGSFNGIMALEDSQHSVPFSSEVFLFAYFI